ncbi:MAG: DUF3421 domain-containing protein [Pseudomonadota bacterium]|nr:DUF3421 domain-containing protein [Pseudomonadota bacterium]
MKKIIFSLCVLISATRVNAAPLNIQWINYENNMPFKELVNANPNTDQLKVHICQSFYAEHGVYPGQLDRQSCVLTYGRRKLTMKHYNALASKTAVFWLPSLKENRHKLILGGMENNRPVYICRGSFKNNTYVGRVVGKNCQIAARNRVVTLRKFDALYN